jgi:cell wall-associated NlpC family hydrolase
VRRESLKKVLISVGYNRSQVKSALSAVDQEVKSAVKRETVGKVMASVGYDKSQLNAVMKAAGTDTGNSFMRAFAGIVGGGGSGGGGGMATKAGQGGGNLLSGGLTSPVGIAGIIAAGLTSLPFIAETAAAGIVTAFGGALTAMGALGAFGTGSATPAQVKAGQNALQLAQLRLQNAQAAKNPNAATVLSSQNSVTAAQSNLTALKNNELSPGQQQVRNSFKSLSQSAQGDLSKIGVSFIPVMQSIFNTANGVLGKLTPVFASATRVISGPFKVFSDTIIKAFGSPEVKLSIAAVAGSFGKLLGALTPQIGPDINQLALAIARIANTIAAHPQDFASFVRFLTNIVTFALDAIDWLTKVAQYITEHFGPALHHIANVFDGVRRQVALQWDAIYSDTIGWVIRISHNVEAELDRMHKQIASVFDTIRHDMAHYWDLIFQATIGTVIRLVGDVDKNLGDLKTNIGRWISDVRNDITGGWNNILHDTTQILGKIVNWVESNFIRPVKNAFSQFVSELPGIWNKIQDIVEKPVKFIVNTVYDGGIARFWNDVASPLHLPKLPIWHLAGGGPVIGPGSATSDSVPVMASHGEFMINAAAAKAIGTENLHALNSVASSGGRSYNAAGTAYRAAGGSIVAQAETYRGHPYVWGGPANPRGGFDCSSFVGMILGMNGITLPGGVKWNPNAHGPVASSYASWPLQAYSSMSPGDLYVEQNGGHVGFVTGPGQGFAAIGRNFGTNFQSVPDSLYNIHQIPGVSGAPGGLGALVNKAGQLVKGAEGLLATATADIMTGAMHALINPLIKKIPGTDSGIGAMVAQMPSALVAALAAKIKSANPNAVAPGGVFGGNPMGGVTGSDMANGKELYLYLKQNLFGGNKIAAAGATASIWGESGWNPFAQGTGGRGLIGWTPPGKISNAVFSGGMKTQLPAILQFVTSNGDLGVVSQMFRSTSVFDAANLWGRGVERFGINDVHPQGVALASSFMKFAKGTDGAPPGWAWVGEQGPELVNMVGGETVLDHHTSMGIGGSFPGYAKGTAQAKAQAKARAAAARNVTAERRTGNSIISALAASFSGGGLPSSGQINSDLSAALKAITVYYSGGKAKNLETQLQKQADSMHTMLAKYTAVEANLAAGRAYATSVTSSLVGYSDLSGLGAVPASGSGKGFGSSIVNNLNLRLTALKNFNNLLKAAAGKGISATFLQQAIALGPDGGTQYLQAMLSGGSGLIKTVNEIEKQTTAVEATIGQNAANIVYSPASMGKGFLTGLTSQAAGLDKAMQNLGHTFAVSVAKDLRIPIKSLPHFAAGGIAQAGTLAMVGENGPELVRFNQTGTVYNAQRTAKMSQPQPQPDVSINFYGPQYPTPEQIANLKLEFSKQMAGYNL